MAKSDYLDGRIAKKHLAQAIAKIRAISTRPGGVRNLPIPCDTYYATFDCWPSRKVCDPAWVKENPPPGRVIIPLDEREVAKRRLSGAQARRALAVRQKRNPFVRCDTYYSTFECYPAASPSRTTTRRKSRRRSAKKR